MQMVVDRFPLVRLRTALAHCACERGLTFSRQKIRAKPGPKDSCRSKHSW